MKMIAAAALLTLTAAPAFAQTAPAAPAAPVAATPGAAAKLTVDSPIEALIADPAAKAVVEGVIPGLSSHPSYDQFKAMSLTQVQPYSGGAITDEIIAKVVTGLAALK